MKQIIFFIVSVIVFIGCEAEKKKVTKISGASSSSNLVESNVAREGDNFRNSNSTNLKNGCGSSNKEW